MTNIQTKNILLSLTKKMKQSKPLPSEFSKLIDDNFWKLF